MRIRGRPAWQEVFNGAAALPPGLPADPLQWRVITTSLDETNRTMATLFGNDLAMVHVRTEAQSPWPPGAEVALVTWKQQEDKHWFGARIPVAVQSVEYVTVQAPLAPDQPAGFVYDLYAGTPLAKQTADPTAGAARAFALMGLRGAVLP